MTWRRRSQRDFEDEIRAHLEIEADELRREGASVHDARLAARRRFGNVSASYERFDDTSRWLWLDHLARDVRYGLRMLRKAPGFSIVTILTLALGIGANTAVFSVVNGVLLAPLPYRDASRLVTLWESLPSSPQIMLSYPDFLDWKQRTRVFDDLALYSPYWSMSMTGADAPERVGVGYASANLFQMLGVKPTLGRDLHADDDRVGAERTALVTEAFWRRRFGSDPSVLQRRVTLDGNVYVIVGVLPPTVGLGRVDFWVPVGLFAAAPNFGRDNHPGLRGLGRLKAGVTVEQMAMDLTRVAAQLREEHPKENAGIGAGGGLFATQLFRSVLPALKVLSWAVAFVLLVACANVANLFLTRVVSRRKEIALRTAIGASSSRIVRLLVTESLVLGLVGGAAGVALAYAGVNAMLAARPTGIPRLNSVHIDGTVLLFALAVSLITSILFGLLPAVQSSRPNLHDTLKESGRANSAARGALRVGRVLMATEVALALVLVVGAGLLVRSFARLTRVDVGVDSHGVLTGSIDLPAARYPDEKRQRLALEQILERVRALPSVTSAALTSALPLGMNSGNKITFEGHPLPKGNEPLLNVVMATPDYFPLMKIRQLSGRALVNSDVDGAPFVVVLSDYVARTYFPGENPIGKHIKHGAFDTTEPDWLVVGVVHEVKESDLGSPQTGTIYLPFAQHPQESVSLVVRSSSTPGQVFPMLRREVAAFDRALPLASEATLDDLIGESVAQDRFTMWLLVTFSAVALLLAAVGVYGVISYFVAQRLHEIGIRAALGASTGSIVGLVSGRALVTTLGGLVAGVIAAFLSRELIAKMLYGIGPTDALTYAGGALLIIVVSLVASALPTWRATRVSCAEALRSE
jgi:putative ABC transport system permease protein